MKELNVKIKWGFAPEIFVLLIMIIFYPLISLMGHDPIKYIMVIVILTLSLGIIFGSKFVSSEVSE